MSWRDRLRPATFRGIPFRVRAHDAGGSRRVVVHEFPGRDTPLVQDLGRGTETTALQAYIVGLDYDLDRDRLLEALAERGPGELVHPYLGTLRVQVTGYQLEERTDEGGLAIINIAFVEAGDGTAILTSRAGSLQGADDAANGALDGAEAGYDADTFGRPDQVLEGLIATVEGFSSTLAGFSVAGPLRAVARYRRLATRLADAILAVLAFPARQATLVRQAVTELDAAVNSRQVLLGLHLDALKQRPKLRGGAGAFARLRDRNAQSAADLFRTMHAAEAVRAAIRVRWASRQDAERARGLILEEIDSLQRTVGDVAYRALNALAAQLSAALPGPDADLPELLTLTIEAPVPALVLAHRLYGTRARTDALLARNRAVIPHPGLVNTGTRLEVLSA